MNFCPDCNFMVYTKLDREENILTNYCKNCNWEGEYLENMNQDESICVFKKDYSNDYLAENAYTNKYTIHDPTLPRINNIPCINNKCLTNKNYDVLKTLYLKNIDNIVIDINLKSKSDTLERFYKDKGLTNDKYENIVISDSEIITIFNIDINLDSIFSDLFDVNIDILGENSTINKYIKPNREIVFIKYDELNMKYLYLCSTCMTSWKNE